MIYTYDEMITPIEIYAVLPSLVDGLLSLELYVLSNLLVAAVL